MGEVAVTVWIRWVRCFRLVRWLGGSNGLDDWMGETTGCATLEVDGLGGIGRSGGARHFQNIQLPLPAATKCIYIILIMISVSLPFDGFRGHVIHKDIHLMG